MVDGTSTVADDPVVCGARRLRSGIHRDTVTLVFQKRYFVDHLRLQIVGHGHGHGHGQHGGVPWFYTHSLGLMLR